MLVLTAMLLSLGASTAGGLAVGGGAADLCTLGEALCQPAFAFAAAVDGPREHAVYASPAEVDCKAAVATVAAHSRADLQLESGDCSAPTTDDRFRVSRLPDATIAIPVAAPQRARRNGRTASAPTACRGIPDRLPPAFASTGAQPLALVSTPGLLPPAAAAPFAPSTGELREGRGGEPPDEPPRSGR